MVVTLRWTRLSRFVRRPTHPVRSPVEAVASMGVGNRWFTQVDALQGYYQVPLRREDRDLTTFITPWERFRFCRAPMGLVSSGN